jgi:hypothetical protein
MSINNSQQVNINGSRIFNDYSVSEGSSNSIQEETMLRRAEQDFNDLDNFNKYLLKKPYSIPLNVVRSKVYNVKNSMQAVYEIYEDILRNVYINPYLDPDMEECHIEMWHELGKKYPRIISSTIKEEGVMYIGGSSSFNEITGEYEEVEVEPPRYISFEQYLYAEQHGCRACRKFVKEYDKLISHSVFVHLFDFRYYLSLLLHEIECIQNSLENDFGDTYDDESQEQTAVFFFSWAKMAENHTRLIAEELTEEKQQLPSSEVDNVSKKQAAQFQAFFSIRVAAYTESIDNLLFSMKKYLQDTCDIFYQKHVSPSIRFKSKVAAPLELDLLTTSMRSLAPILSEEVITATNAFRGNFGSILADMVQRRNNTQDKFNKLFSLNRQRKKYINYIDQLSVKASERPKIIVNVDEDLYSEIFKQIIIDPSERLTLSSGHGSLNDLLENHHPQYLLRSGGTIFGDILVEDGITIDGVDISAHAHNGLDGSVRIKSTDIDYDSVREETTLLQTEEGNLLTVSVDSFQEDIKISGLPTVNATVTITVPDGEEDKYEYEIIYLEN